MPPSSSSALSLTFFSQFSPSPISSFLAEFSSSYFRRRICLHLHLRLLPSSCLMFSFSSSLNSCLPPVDSRDFLPTPSSSQPLSSRSRFSEFVKTVVDESIFSQLSASPFSFHFYLFLHSSISSFAAPLTFSLPSPYLSRRKISATRRPLLQRTPTPLSFYIQDTRTCPSPKSFPRPRYSSRTRSG